MPFLEKPKKTGFMPRKRKITTPPSTCVLCLQSILSKQSYFYTTSSCKCNIHLHDTCFTKKNSGRPSPCPTCKKYGIYVQNSRVQQVAVVGTSDDEGWCACILGCWGCMTFLEAFTS